MFTDICTRYRQNESKTYKKIRGNLNYLKLTLHCAELVSLNLVLSCTSDSKFLSLEVGFKSILLQTGEELAY